MSTLKKPMAARLHCGVACLASIIVTTVAAQEADSKGGGLVLEEIVVTARKRTENVQDVPLTVNVLTAAALEERGVRSVAEIDGLVSNVVWESPDSWSRNKITIRGISSNQSNSGFDPGVGIYVDDVYLPNGSSFSRALLDIERIEILKGPQGTLFGRNTTAGAISITTRRPSQQAYLQADADLGNYDLRQFRAVANTPLSERTAFKIAGIYRERDGYDLNTVSNERDLNTEQHYGGHAQLLFTPSDSLDILASADWYKDLGAQGSLDCAGAGSLGRFCGGRTFADLLDRRLESNSPNEAEREMWGTSLTATWSNAAGYALTSISAYRHLATTDNHDGDQTRAELLRNGGGMPGRQWQVSQELRLATPADKRLRAVAGVYYFKEEKSIATLVSIDPIGLAPFGIIVADNQDATMLADQGTDSYAAFGQVSYDIAPTVTAEIGLRYTRDEKDFTYEQQVAQTLVGLPGIPIRVAPSSDSNSWGAVTGTASLAWHLDDDLMTYARFSRGYKSGGYNANNATAGQINTKPFDPEYLDNYEIGMKYEAANRRLRLNAAAFMLNYTDLQFQIRNELRQRFIANAGEAESKGAEIELTYLPFAGLELSLNAGVQRAKYKKFTASNLAALTGKDLESAPHATGAASASYFWPLSAGLQALVSTTAIYRGDNWLEETNTVEQDSYVLVNARIGVEDGEERWAVYLYSNNLTDVERLVNYTGANLTNAMAGLLNAPRTYGVEMRMKF